MIKYKDDREIELNDLLFEVDDHFDGNEFGFLDRRKIRNLLIAS